MWLSDPAWLAMDATARGFHVQLLLLAARRRPAGTLPDDDLLWRRYLGLPTKIKPVKTTQTSMWAKTVSETGLPDIFLSTLRQLMESDTKVPVPCDPDDLALWLWQYRWKPMVLAGWEKIDAGMVEIDYRLAGVEGGWLSRLSKTLSKDTVENAIQTANPTTRKPGLSARMDATHWGNQVAQSGDAANAGLLHLTTELGVLRNVDSVLAKWRAETTQETRQTLWDVGVGCLAGTTSTSTQQRNARSILGKHIKQYGEEVVAKAVARMAMRTMPPADAVSFLQGLLKQETEGSVAEQNARKKRSSLCL